MEQREKLIELLMETYHLSPLLMPCNAENGGSCDLTSCEKCRAKDVADHLLANGVVVLPCRCGECESFSEGMCDNEHIGAMVFRMKREPTDYCSYAKRKGGDYCDEE